MKTDNSAASVFFALVADCRIGTVMKMGLLTGILLGGTLLVLSVIVVLGIIYLRLETKTKIKAGTIKDYIKNLKVEKYILKRSEVRNADFIEIQGIAGGNFGIPSAVEELGRNLNILYGIEPLQLKIKRGIVNP